jgi:hypothetical protein
MARPKVKKPLSNAERQAAYRERKKAAGLKRQSGWVDPRSVIPEPAGKNKDQEKKAWREELKAEELKAARKEGRLKERTKNQRQGYLTAISSVCGFFIRRERPDIAKSLLKEFYISREDFIKAQFGSFELSVMDKAGIFEKPDNQPGKGDIDSADR